MKIPLPQLPPGNYRVAASGADASDAEGVVGHFACLPARPAPSGDANRFGVNVWATSLLPPSRLDAFAAAMRDMGAGWIRDGQAWPAAEPTPGTYDTEHHDRVTRTMRRHGLSPLEVLSPAPEWAMTAASLPLPADLRHAYRYARRLASGRPAAIQLSNEPDVDVTSSTGDAHAAFVKAAALGIADSPRPAARRPAGHRAGGPLPGPDAGERRRAVRGRLGVPRLPGPGRAGRTGLPGRGGRAARAGRAARCG